MIKRRVAIHHHLFYFFWHSAEYMALIVIKTIHQYFNIFIPNQDAGIRYPCCLYFSNHSDCCLPILSIRSAGSSSSRRTTFSYGIHPVVAADFYNPNPLSRRLKNSTCAANNIFLNNTFQTFNVCLPLLGPFLFQRFYIASDIKFSFLETDLINQGIFCFPCRIAAA